LLALALLAAGSLLLASGSHLRPAPATAAAPALLAQGATPANPLATAPAPQVASDYAKRHALSMFSGLPLIFEPNRGQANLDPSDRRAKFLAHGSDYGLYFGPDGAILTLRSRTSQHQVSQPQAASAHSKPARIPSTRLDLIEMKLAGANPNATLTPADPLPGKTNYLIGNDPAQWRRGLPQFARLRYDNVYPGINLVFYGNQGHLEYDFQVAPGADPAQAELEFRGARQLQLQDGALVIQSAGGSVQFAAPRVYQQIAGRQQPVDGRFVLLGHNRAGFALGPYDHSRELVIDPVLSFSTFFGGSGDELNSFVAVDAGGNIYLTGSTKSQNLPALGVFQTTLKGTQNVYIAKIAPQQGTIPSSLVYVTYLGGTGMESPVGIVVDAGLSPMVAGTTTSQNFPTSSTNAYESVPEPLSTGPHHVFVTRLDPAAQNLEYSSYLSGNGDDIASGVALDNNEDVFVTGTTTSTDQGVSGSPFPQFPSSASPNIPAFQTASIAAKQFFVTEVRTSSSGPGSIGFSTYFGGGATASATTAIVANGGGITVDPQGANIYFDGTTNFIFSGNSPFDFPIKNAYQPCLDTPPPAQIINPVTCPNTPAPVNPDAFVAKLTLTAGQQAQLQWSTYVGGVGTDSASGIAIDAGAANVYIVGTTNSQVFTIPTTIAPYQRCLNNLPPTLPSGTVTCTTQTDPAPFDAFVARFNNPSATITNPAFNLALTYFSYLGGSTATDANHRNPTSGNDEGAAITVDSTAGALVTGFTECTDFPIFPTPNDGIQNTLNGPRDAFLARINTNSVIGQNQNGSFATYFGGAGTDEGTSITLDGNLNTYFAGDTNSTAATFRVASPIQPNNNGGFDAFVTKFGTASTLSLTGQLQLGTNQTFISAGNPATFIYTLINNGPDPAVNVTVTDTLNNSQQSGTGVTVTPISASATNNGTCTGTGSSASNVVCTIPTLPSASTATITIVLTPAATPSGNSLSFNGGIVQATAANGVGSNQSTVTAEMSDFTISALPNNFTVAQAGDTATYEIELIPHPVYGSSISLSVTGLPAATHQQFSVNSISLANSSSGGATLSISTTVRPIVTPAASLFTRHFYAVCLWIPGMALLGLGTASGRRRRRILGIIAFCAMFSLLLLLPACSHGTTQVPSTGTPPGTSTLTITATSGSDTKSTTVTLTVP